MSYLLKGKRFGVRITAVFMAFIIGMATVFSMPVSSYAEDEENMVLTETSVEDMKKSMEKIIHSVDELKEMMSEKDAETLEAIFAGLFTSAVDVGGTIIGVINGANTFLQLIGVTKDKYMKELANITEQLTKISEHLDRMDGKLDDITQKMIDLKAQGTFLDRIADAREMKEAWKTFHTHYIEEQMEELIRQHNVLLLREIENWMETDRTNKVSDPDVNKVFLLYKAYEQEDGSTEWTLEHTLENEIIVEDGSPDRYLILDETFLPDIGMRFNVNSYREKIKGAIKLRLMDLRDEALDDESTQFGIEPAGAIAYFFDDESEDGIEELFLPEAEEDTEELFAAEAGDEIAEEDAHYEAYNIFPAEWTDEDVEQFANDATDAIMYRLNWYAINRDGADFSTKVKKQYEEYCSHLTPYQEGVNALLQTFYLTHAFEYEVADDITAVCNRMILQAGVYSMFAMNVVGMSKYIKDEDKTDVADCMCSSVNGLNSLLDNGLTGNDRYCYVTHSVIDYGEVTFTGKVDVNYKTRGVTATYLSCSGGGISSVYFHEGKAETAQPVLIGDANALVIAYHVATSVDEEGNPQTFDQDYMDKYLTTPETLINKRSSVVTSLNGQIQLALDNSCLLRTYRVVGNWFSNGSNYYLNGLPSGCTSEYIVYRKGMQGSLYTGGTVTPQVYKTLIGTAAYGENHWYWEKDESAVMGGPSNDPSFTQNNPDPVKTDISFWGDYYYRKSYSNSVTYNTLIQVPVVKIHSEPGPYPLDELEAYTSPITLKAEFEDLIKDAEAALINSNLTTNSGQELRNAISEAYACLENSEATALELIATKGQLENVLQSLSYEKITQELIISTSPQGLTVSDVKDQDQIVDGIMVENAKGEVSFALRSVSDKQYEDMFEIAPETGLITIKKGLPEGSYTLAIRTTAKGNEEYQAASVTATMAIVIEKQAQKMTVSAKTQSFKATAVKSKNKVLSPLTVKNAVGKVTYKITSVSNDKYKNKFSINDKGKITVKKGLPGGTYTLKVQVSAAGDDEYNPKTKTVSVKITVKKVAQSMTATAKLQKVNASDLKKQNKVLKAITVKKAKGSVTYTLSSVNNTKYKGKFTVNKKTGKITVKKGLPKGTYTLKVKVTAAGNGVYKAKSKTVSVKISVK